MELTEAEYIHTAKWDTTQQLTKVTETAANTKHKISHHKKSSMTAAAGNCIYTVHRIQHYVHYQ